MKKISESAKAQNFKGEINAIVASMVKANYSSLREYTMSSDCSMEEASNIYKVMEETAKYYQWCSNRGMGDEFLDFIGDAPKWTGCNGNTQYCYWFDMMNDGNGFNMTIENKVAKVA